MRGRPRGTKKTFTLDDGQKVTLNEVMVKTGCKDSAVRQRLSQSRDPAVIFAPKGAHKDYGYGRRKVLKKPKKIAKINTQRQDKMATYIVNNKPFYADPLYRLALMKISCKTRTNKCKKSLQS